MGSLWSTVTGAADTVAGPLDEAAHGVLSAGPSDGFNRETDLHYSPVPLVGTSGVGLLASGWSRVAGVVGATAAQTAANPDSTNIATNAGLSLASLVEDVPNSFGFDGSGSGGGGAPSPSSSPWYVEYFPQLLAGGIGLAVLSALAPYAELGAALAEDEDA